MIFLTAWILTATMITHRLAIAAPQSSGPIHRRSALNPPGRTRKALSIRRRSLWTIAYVKGSDIWTAFTDGSHAKRIIQNGSLPCWAFDHAQIVFVRADGEIWLAAATGSGLRRLVSADRPDRRTNRVQGQTILTLLSRGDAGF